jgi:hypothetical protein
VRHLRSSNTRSLNVALATEQRHIIILVLILVLHSGVRNLKHVSTRPLVVRGGAEV